MAAKINQYGGVAEAQNALAREISIIIDQSSNAPLLLLLSGGSCLTILPLIQEYLERIPPKKYQLTIGMVDERFDTEESNFVHLKKDYGKFYDFMTKRDAVFIDTSPKLKDQYEMAEWYEKELYRHPDKRRDLSIVIILGMGPDGHIAGIMPYPDAEQETFYETFLDTDKLVVGYDATGKNKFTKRFTLTYPALLRANSLFAYIVGDEKKAALHQALKENPPLHRCPVYYFQTTKQDVSLYTNLALGSDDKKS